jgi:hypothetical protein
VTPVVLQVPVAPANRPVPPMTVSLVADWGSFCASKDRTPPTDRTVSVSPLAAVKVIFAVQHDFVFALSRTSRPRGTCRDRATLAERKTRFVMLIGLPNGHSADIVADALAAKIGELPAQLRRSIIWDQALDKHSNGDHHHKHSTNRCDDP